MSNAEQEQAAGPFQQVLPVFLAVIGFFILGFFIYFFRAAFSSVSDLTEFLAAAKMAASGHGAQLFGAKAIDNRQ